MMLALDRNPFTFHDTTRIGKFYHVGIFLAQLVLIEEKIMSESRIGITQADKGCLVYYHLNHITQAICGSNIDIGEFGVCEYENLYWVGKRVSVEGRDTLRLTLADVLDRRDMKYEEWGDEELVLFVGIDKTDTFRWFLLNQDEADEAMSFNLEKLN